MKILFIILIHRFELAQKMTIKNFDSCALSKPKFFHCLLMVLRIFEVEVLDLKSDGCHVQR